MAEDLYNRKLESLQQFIPFLDNMILQLKDPSKKNREQQLNKMMSLHAMITDKRKKLKLETLIKCEDVISKLYEKVHNKPLNTKQNCDTVSLTPASPSPPREIDTPQPLTIPTERLEENRIPKIDIYSSAAESLIRSRNQQSMSLGTKIPDMSKPPISLEDLKTLEDDVQEKINEKSLNQASLQELNSLRQKLTEQIHLEDVLLKSPQKYRRDDLESINTTVRNNLTLTKKVIQPCDKSKIKEKESNKFSPNKPLEASPSTSSPKKEHKSSQSSAKSPKILKEPDSIFGSILSHIDDQILEGKKKKEERRNSITGKDEKKSEKDGKRRDRTHSGSKEDISDERKDAKKNDSIEDKSKTKDEKKSRDKDSDTKKKERHHQSGDKIKFKDDNKDGDGKEGIKKDDKNLQSNEEKLKDSFSLSGKKSFEAEEEQLKKSLETSDKPKPIGIAKDQINNVVLKDADKNSTANINDNKDLKTSVDGNNKVEETTKQTTFKRLADKYHPKPRKPSTEPDVDKELSEIIEEKMKSSPPKLPMINKIPAPVPPPVSLLMCSQMEPEAVPKLPPVVMQNMLTPGTTELINTVVNQLRQNTAEIEAKKMPLSHPSPAETFMSDYGSEDNFVSEYAREDFSKNDFGPINIPKFQPPGPSMRRERLNFEPPPPLLNNQFNQMNHQNQRFIPPAGDGFRDNFAQNMPFTPRPPVFPQPNLNIQNPPYDIQSLDYYPPNAPIPANQYNCGPPLLSPEIPHFHTEQKPVNFGMMPNHEPFRHNEDMRWRREDNNFSWDRRDQDARLNRDPRTYREYREMRESRDPRVANRDPRENPRDNPRDPRAIRDPRVNRDLRDNRDPRENRDPRDPRLNKDRDFDRDGSRFRDNRQPNETRTSRYDTRFDMVYSRTNRGRSRSRSRSRSYSKETFTSPLDSLYTGKEEHKTGKGYGVQSFRIPKIKKDEDDKEQSTKVSSTNEDDTAADIPQVVNDESNDSLNNEVTGNDVETEDAKQKEEAGEETETKDKENEKDTNEKEVELEKTNVEPPKLHDETEETKAVEDSKPAADTAEKDQEKPADQMILAQFFANLLGSKNKKDKKTALYSLISTFSDSFSEKELSKITKIIKADDDEAENADEEGEVKTPSLEQKSETESAKEPEKEMEVEDIPPEGSPVKTTKRKRRIRRISSTASLKDEQTKEGEIAKTPEPSDAPVTDEESVVVSVGERIKSRKRATGTPSKPKKKCKTELDMLHEDIQDMFIRDGVLTATGKRMCRILKGDPNALTAPQPSPVEGQKIRKKPGPKPKQRSNSTEMKAVKNIRVLIPKMPDIGLEQKEESPRRTLRSTRKTVYTESDGEDTCDTVDDDSVQGDGSFRDESDEESTDTEKDKSLTTDNTNKTKVIKRKRGKGWASGNIPSNKRRKRKQLPVEDEPDSKDASSAQSDTDKSFVEPDKNYYVDFVTNKSHECKLCNYQGRFITTHYKTHHPQSEVLTSRFSPAVAQEAMEDAEKNLARYEEMLQISGSGKYHFTCRFCAFNTTVPPTIFYDHITTHTGEYRHICPMCDFSASSGKTLKSHMLSVHKNADKRVARKSYSQTVIFAYMCGECNYVQLNKKNVEDHINIFHLQKPTIYKVNMSTTTDPQVVKLAEMEPKQDEVPPAAEDEIDSEDEVPITSRSYKNKIQKAMPPPRPKKRLKAAPKCVKDKLKARQAAMDDSASDTSSVTESESSMELERPIKSVSKKRLTRELSMTSDEDIIIGGRSRRAAKDKAAEKLKSLMEASESGSRKKSLSVSGDEEKTKKEEPRREPDADKNDQSETKQVKIESKVTQEKPEIPAVKKEIEMNVFTCETDIQEENKKIEQERLQLMDELNKTVGSRTSLNFVDKLCNRLNQNDIMVKQEPRDDLTDSLFPSELHDTTMPVLEKNLPTHVNEHVPAKPPVFPTMHPKKPVLITEDMQMSNSNFDVTQKNDKLITDMIQKLKGKLAGTPAEKSDNSTTVDEADYDNEGPPPLTHVLELPNVKPTDGSTKILLIGGLVKVIKYPTHLMFSCLVPPCVFSSESKEAFQKHCSEAHKQQDRSTLCEMCGMEIATTTDCTLLENIFKHAIKEHDDFMNAEFKPQDKESKPASVLRIRKLSGDALSVKKDWEEEIDNSSGSATNAENPLALAIPEPIAGTSKSADEPPPSIAELDMSDENPFPFKISGVMSLAEPVPPLAPIAKPLQMTSSTQLIVKEARLTQAEQNRPKKTPRAMSKFVTSVSDLYKCPHYYCLFTTNFRYFIERHLKAHKVEKDLMIPCVYCDMKTPWEHVPMHIDIRHAHCRFACSYCLYRAVLKEYVFLHQDQAHPEKDYSVIALPQAKHSKKWAIADVKMDPKNLCVPYKCTQLCGVEYLFENEFRKHLQDVHKSNFIPCGFRNCVHRVQANKMPNHWSLTHFVSLYQCGHCKFNSSEMKNLYKHFAMCHQGLQPDILIRMHTQLQEGVTLGYTPEAFALLRKVVTIPTNISGDSKSDAYLTEPATVLASTKTGGSLKVITTSLTPNIPNSPHISITKPVTCHAITLVSTKSPTPSGGNIIILPSTSGTVMSPKSNKPVTTIASDDKIVKIVASATANDTVIPALLDVDAQKTTQDGESLAKDDTEGGDHAIEPLEHITVTEDGIPAAEENDTCEADPLSLEAESELQETSKSAADSSGDESEGNKLDKSKKEAKNGLLSYQLYRCAFCDFSFSNSTDFKKHVLCSLTCRTQSQVAKPYTCVHCEKQLKNPNMLVEHIQCHGVLRFACSLCGNKFATIAQTRNHMKNRHNITHTYLTPLNPAKQNIETDEYLVRPKQMGAAKDATSAEPAASASTAENIYTPDTIDKIPMRHILGVTAKCGLCQYSTKVRTNMVRHLQFHSEEKAVPDTAPVNPVPCLEKNEKMFDKMINLASSSHTNSRMGGTKPDLKDEKVNLPEFVPSHCRYVCCAHGCNYICPEEGNLRHHLIALHDGETSFTCVHCKGNLTPTDADSLIKHFKLHGLQLYKCPYCPFIHNLKHKVEKHITDGHLDLPLKITTVRFMETEPKDATQETSASSSQSAPAPAPTTKYYKPWRCCMCKYKCNSQDGIQNHVLEKHEIEAQFKCALCAYKTDDQETFPEHFRTTHDNQTVDIIYAYRKMEDDKEKESEAFDTTPLWQRDRPRVRHIRGILFDESTPSPSAKSPKKAKYAAIAPAPGPSGVKVATPSTGSGSVRSATPSPGPSGVKISSSSSGTTVPKVATPPPGPSGLKTNESDAKIVEVAASETKSSPAPAGASLLKNSMDQSIESVVNGTADILKEASSCVADDFFQVVNQMMKESNEDIARAKDSMVIVIEDDDEPKTPVAKDKDNKNAPVAKNRMLKRKATEAPGISKIAKISDEIIDLESSGSDTEQDEFGEKSLKLRFGGFGSPLWKQFKCPVCNSFKSKRISDFVFHIFKEMKTFRFKCKVCTDESITYRYMHKHVSEHHGEANCDDSIASVAPNEGLLVWLQMVIREQSLIIMQNYPKTPQPAAGGDDLVQCEFCQEKFNTEQEKNEHSVGHWTGKPYFCSTCSYTAFMEKDVIKHFHSAHEQDARKTKETAMVYSKGPTVPKLLKISDDQHAKEVQPRQPSEEVPLLVPIPLEPAENCDPLDDVPAADQGVSGLQEAAAASAPEETADDAVLSDSDLIIVTKTDTNVPTDNDIFCCEYCPYMASNEVRVLSHITAEHGNLSISFKKLNRETCEDPKEHVGCTLCPAVGSEVKIRQHHMDKHKGMPLSLYRFQCGVCRTQKRFLKFVGLKGHFSRLHPGCQLQYKSLYGDNEGDRTVGMKTYKCPVCPYERNLKSNAVSNVRQHLKQHFRAFMCGTCRSTKYKTRADVLSHYAKEHPGAETQQVVQDAQILENYNAAMAGIIANAVDYYEAKPARKNTARKSTSAPHSSATLAEYSFYGVPPEPVDMSKIMTSVDVNGLKLDMSAERLSKIIDLDVVVAVQDCNLSVNLSSVFDS